MKLLTFWTSWICSGVRVSPILLRYSWAQDNCEHRDVGITETEKFLSHTDFSDQGAWHWQEKIDSTCQSSYFPDRYTKHVNSSVQHGLACVYHWPSQVSRVSHRESQRSPLPRSLDSTSTYGNFLRLWHYIFINFPAFQNFNFCVCPLLPHRVPLVFLRWVDIACCFFVTRVARLASESSSDAKSPCASANASSLARRLRIKERSSRWPCRWVMLSFRICLSDHTKNVNISIYGHETDWIEMIVIEQEVESKGNAAALHNALSCPIIFGLVRSWQSLVQSLLSLSSCQNNQKSIKTIKDSRKSRFGRARSAGLEIARRILKRRWHKATAFGKQDMYWFHIFFINLCLAISLSLSLSPRLQALSLSLFPFAQCGVLGAQICDTSDTGPCLHFLNAAWGRGQFWNVRC